LNGVIELEGIAALPMLLLQSLSRDGIFEDEHVPMCEEVNNFFTYWN
jgi:hypothetical protein